MSEPDLLEMLRNPPEYRCVFDESERQMILLALHRLAESRPGFAWAIGEIAAKLGGQLDWPPAYRAVELDGAVAGAAESLVAAHDSGEHEGMPTAQMEALRAALDARRIGSLPLPLAKGGPDGRSE